MSKKKAVDCTLCALANGRLQDWSGIQPTFSRTDAQKAFGPSKSDRDKYGLLGGSPTAFREYFPTAAAPLGMTVWYVDEQMILIRLLQPKLAESLTQMLGQPETTTSSQLQRFHTQWIYAQRGLTAHVHNATSEVLRLYAYRPTTTREFLNSWLSRVQIRRISLRRERRR